MDQVPDILKNFQWWKYVLHILMENQESSLFCGSENLFHDHLNITSRTEIRGMEFSSIHEGVTFSSPW